MSQRTYDLADLLTAAGAAMACANQRLRAANAPALLQSFQFGLEMGALPEVPVAAEEAALLLGGVNPLNAQLQALGLGGELNVAIQATYIAAPSLVPVPST